MDSELSQFLRFSMQSNNYIPQQNTNLPDQIMDSDNVDDSVVNNNQENENEIAEYYEILENSNQPQSGDVQTASYSNQNNMDSRSSYDNTVHMATDQISISMITLSEEEEKGIRDVLENSNFISLLPIFKGMNHFI